MADDEHDGALAVSTGDAGVEGAQKEGSLGEARSSDSPEESPSSPRAFVSYTRPQILALYNSPLVKPMDHMPSLKEWFGCVARLHLAALLFDCASAESGPNKTTRATVVEILLL